VRGHASQQEHDQDLSAENLSNRVVEESAMRAIFPNDRTRRRFLAAVGGGAALAALYAVLPIRSLQSMASDDPIGPLERKSLKVGFLPINCATPLIMADPMGHYAREGLDVSLVKTPGWALVRDHMLNGELDASHFLAPMPLAISMGLGSQPQPMRVASIQNINGQAITMALKHRNNRDPRNWKGMKFAIPFDYSMHNFLCAITWPSTASIPTTTCSCA
jgi:nitrate/nitrite transport system substrate-binding protein